MFEPIFSKSHVLVKCGNVRVDFWGTSVQATRRLGFFTCAVVGMEAGMWCTWQRWWTAPGKFRVIAAARLW